MKALYQPPVNPQPFGFTLASDLRLKIPGTYDDPDAKKLGLQIGRHILANAARGHFDYETVELVAEALGRSDGILTEYRTDVLEAIASVLVTALRAGLGIVGWPGDAQGDETK